MIDRSLFFVSAGEVDPDLMAKGCRTLAKEWSAELLFIESAKTTINNLDSFVKSEHLICLQGDAALFQSSTGSWLEALAAYQYPVILMAEASKEGIIPGSASAYSALCRLLKVSLLGIVQLGGKWNADNRRLDGLPWCGRISSDLSIERNNQDNIQSFEDEQIKQVAFILKRNLYALKN